MSSTNTREIDDNTINDLYEKLKHFGFGGSSYDAFARLRVSTPTTVFESKQIVSEQDLLWERGQVSGAGGSFLYSRPRASSTISVSNLTAGRYVRRTRRYFNYHPGKGQLILMSAVLGPKQQGINRRIGYFDDDNGIFFGVNHESLYCAIRSGVTGVPVTTLFHQQDWNIDKLDGTGPSGITIDTTRANIYWFDFEWLGVGRVRWGIFVAGIPIPMHELNFANMPLSTSVYMSTPNLPMTAEIENDGTGAAASLEQICSSVISEGGERVEGVSRSVSSGATAITVAGANLVPIISLRTRVGFEFQSISIIELSVISTSNVFFRWALVLNPTLAGVDPATWVAVPSSTAEFAINRTSANFVTAGTVIDEGYVSSSTRSVSATPDSFLSIGKRLLASSPKDQFVLAVQNVSGAANADYFGSITYREAV